MKTWSDFEHNLDALEEEEPSSDGFLEYANMLAEEAKKLRTSDLFTFAMVALSELATRADEAEGEGTLSKGRGSR